MRRVVSFLRLLFAFYLLSACYQRAGTIPVAVMAWPAPIRPPCDVPSLPEAPIFIGRHNTEDGSNVIERYYVNARDVAEVVQWNADVKHWADQITRCLQRLTDRAAP